MSTVQNKTSITAWVPKEFAPLYEKGYRIAEAARLVGCSAPHLRWVLEGKRTPSAELTEKLNNLPKKKLCLLAG